MDDTSKRTFKTYVLMYLWAALWGLILTLALFLRNGPYGIPYVMDIPRYLPSALFYMMFGLAFICFPFMLVSVIRKKATHAGTITCAILLALSLLIGQIDNEVLRFCNVHITLDFLRTYVLSAGTPDVIWTLLAEDKGGANVSLILLGSPAVFLILWFLFGNKISQKIPKLPRIAEWIVFGFIGILFIFLPILLRTELFGSKNRQAKVAPPIILVNNTIREYLAETNETIDISPYIKPAQDRWLAAESNHHWKFTDPSRPFFKEHEGECTGSNEPVYNIVVLSLETFRAKNLPLFTPQNYNFDNIDPTPFLTKLAQDPHSVYYTNYYTNGHPTIAGFMAQHTSLLPHSTRTVAKSYTINKIESYASILRKYGYETTFFAGSDPDWDNQRAWLNRWYEHIFYNPKFDEKDRLVVQDMADWAKNRRDPNRPFLMTAFLISNHMPFHVREENLRLTDETELQHAIVNTMYYDDDVLREFFESIKDEPWFNQTVFFITGDHGMDLGDRGDPPDYGNMRHEATHLPLIIYSPTHTRLPHGKQTTIASHIDLGPTILDLAHICEPNAFMGHSLLTVVPEQAQSIAVKFERFALDTPNYSAYMPDKDHITLFSRDDYMQMHDISATHPDIAKNYFTEIIHTSALVDECYRKDLFH